MSAKCSYRLYLQTQTLYDCTAFCYHRYHSSFTDIAHFLFLFPPPFVSSEFAEKCTRCGKFSLCQIDKKKKAHNRIDIEFYGAM